MRSAGPRPLLLGLVGAGLLAGSWSALKLPLLQQADVRAGDALRESGSGAVEGVVIGTTDLGSLYAVGGAASALAACGQREAATDVAGLGLLGWCLSQWAKTRVRRVRPYDSEGTRRLLRRPTGSSFPSGHAAVATAVALVLAERTRPRGAGLALLGPYVAATRVYAGVHCPSDVLGGVGMGCMLWAGWRGGIARGGRCAVTVAARLGLASARPLVRALSGLRLP